MVDELTEAKVKLETLGHLVWFYNPIGTETPDNFGWGLGMLMHHIEKDLIAVIEKLKAENGKP